MISKLYPTLHIRGVKKVCSEVHHTFKIIENEMMLKTLYFLLFNICDMYDFGWLFSALQFRKCPPTGLYEVNTSP